MEKEKLPEKKGTLRSVLLLEIGIFLLVFGIYSYSPVRVMMILPVHHQARVLSAATQTQSQPIVGNLRIPVLMYHYVRVVGDAKADPLGYGLSVTPENFRLQMQYLADNKYQTISLPVFRQHLATNTAFPSNAVMITFDDGYRDFYENAYPVLKDFNFSATIFVITDFVSDKQGRYLTWEEIKDLDQSGLIGIGSHTLDHPDLKTSNRAKVEITQSKQILENYLGHPIEAFCYPGGSYDQTTVSLVEQAGYELAFTIRPGAFHAWGKRFELPRVRVGGGYDLKKFEEKLDERI